MNNKTIRLNGKKWTLPEVISNGDKWCSPLYLYDALEFRTPKKGEFYISGSIPAMYLATNDLGTSYLIASNLREVKKKTITVYEPI